MGSCLRPITINRPNKRCPDSSMIRLGLYNLRNEFTVPCGKCVECLKRRQADLATRAMREANKRGSMQFLTLTYDDVSLPLQVRLERIDKESGEVFHDLVSSPLVRYKGLVEDDCTKEFVKVVRNELSRIIPGCSSRVITKPFFETENDLYRYEITPSLNRRDVRLWLKRCRVRYFREKGIPLSDFSYIVCGEYGPKTCRPHYHVALFGLSFSEASYLAAQWDYGFTNLKSVNAFNPDGTNGFEIASKYIGKYMSKGKFECDSVKCGLSEKPRLMLSRFLGNEVSEELISYFRCYDVFGHYDITTCRFSDGRDISDADFLKMNEVIKSRSHLVFGNSQYCLPRSLIIKIWFVYDKTSSCYYSSNFRVKMSSLVFHRPFEEFTRMLRESCPDLSSRAFLLRCSEFISCSENSSNLREAFEESSLQSFYNKSIF